MKWMTGAVGLRLSIKNLMLLPITNPSWPLKAIASNVDASLIALTSSGRPMQTLPLSVQQSPYCSHLSSHQQVPLDFPPQSFCPSAARQLPVPSALPSGKRGSSSELESSPALSVVAQPNAIPAVPIPIATHT